MARAKGKDILDEPTRSRPPLTPEAKKSELMNLALGLAEQKLRDGTASSQLICHFLKLAADEERDNLEKELLIEEKKLKQAKTKSLEAQDSREDTYQRAIDAMRNYTGHGDPDIYG